MRLFIATPVTLPFYQIIKQKLSPYIQGKWVEGYNLHLTHKFIGDDNPDNWKIDLNIPNEKIEIKDFGIFNNKILYMKAISPHIDFIAKQLNVKNFTPHITLCRIKQLDDKLFEKLKTLDFSYKIEFEVNLYSSILTKKGPIYKKIYKYL
jgi:2'-5' RNA ligase